MNIGPIISPRGFRMRIEDLSSQIGMNSLVFLLMLNVNFFLIDGIEDAFYNHNNVRCEKCAKGQKVKVHCSINLHKSECVACEEGTFADRFSSSETCERCVDCRHTDRIIKNNCTLEKNTECKCPDTKYYELYSCRTCEPPKIKRVRDGKEYCENCEYMVEYYNNTVKDCVKCDICTGVTFRVCNETHNAQCKQLPTTSRHTSTTQVPVTEKYKEGLSDGGIAGIVGAFSILILVIIIVGVVVLRRKKKYCFKRKTNRKNDTVAGLPLNNCDNESETQVKQPSQFTRESSQKINLTSPTYPETQTSPFPPETHGTCMLSSKPEWINTICKILIDNLGQLDVFVIHLGTQTFNATAKWQQLDDRQIDTRFLKFMDVWYQQTNRPSLKQIISVLKDMNKNDIVHKVQNDVHLKEQLNRENIRNEHNGVPCNGCATPIQATDDGSCDWPGNYNLSGDQDQRDLLINSGQDISGSDADEEQTALKQPS